MADFKDFIWELYYNSHHDQEDSYKDENGKGLLRRLEETKYGYWDKETIPLIESFAETTVLPATVLPELLKYLEESVGVDLFFDDSPEKRRKVLAYFYRLCQARSTPLGYKAAYLLMDFEKLTMTSVLTETFFSNPLPTAEPNAYFMYEVRLTGTLLTLSEKHLIAFHNARRWNEPINCELLNTGVRYNEDFLPWELAGFSFDDNPPFPERKFDRSAALILHNSRVPEFTAVFDSEGHLILDGPFSDYYEFDSRYFYKEGHLMFRYPTPERFVPFPIGLPDNQTTTSFTFSWDAVPGALSYLADVGTRLENLSPNSVEEGVITDSVFHKESVTDGLSFTAFGLSEDTVYFYRVRAVNAAGTETYSEIKWTISGLFLGSPQNLEDASQSENAIILSWDAVPAATSYRIESSETLDFFAINGTFFTSVNKIRIVFFTGANFFRVIAIAKQSESLPSAVIDFTHDFFVQDFDSNDFDT